MWPALIPLLGGLLDKLLPDPSAAAAAKLELIKLQQSGELTQIVGQLEINKVEAASSSVLVSGARPAILWCCGFAMAYASILEPLMRFIAVVAFHYAGQFPIIDTSITMQVLFGLLGLSGLRSFDKVKGVA
jgi:hypothetical protein